MRGLIIHIALLINIAHCVDYTDYSLPSNISLNGGQRQDRVTSTQSPQGWQMTTIGLNRNPHLSINGTAGSQYSLQVLDTTTTFYSGGFSIGNGIESALTSIHTLAIERGGVSVGSGATFSVISSGTTISEQGSEYGGESKVRFARGTSLNITQNASAEFSNANFFIHDGSTTLSQNANLTISATKAIRFQNKFTNNGGSVKLTSSVYNVGSPVGVRNDNTISTFTINGGSVSITGNFYNGAESKDMSVDSTGGGLLNVYDSAFGGGGNLIINGGNMSVNGTLISQQGGDSINGGGISNPRNSTISIYGGTLSATGGVQNLSGSTLTIGALNKKMGQLIVGAGQKVQNNGSIIIDLAGANAGVIKPFIDTNGSSSSLITGNTQITIKNGNSDFANASSFDNANGVINFTINQNAINNFKATLNANESATLGAFGDDIFTISGASSANLKATANSVNRATFGAFYATPLAMIDTLNADISSTPKRKTATRKIITQRTKSQTRQTRQVRKIATTNPNDINAELVLKGVSTNGTNGILGGIKAGYGVDFANARFALNLAYAYGSISGATKGDIATFATSTKSHNFALNSQLNTRFAGNFGFDLGLSGAIALTNSTRKVESTAINLDSTLKSAQNIYQIAVDSVFLYDFRIRNFTITPYLGLRQGYIAMPKFSESGSGAFVLSAEAYNAYFLDALLGAKMGFDFGNYGAILADLEYKFLAFKTQKERILRYVNATQGADILRFGIPNAHKISVDLGYHKDFNRWYLRIDGNFSALINASKANDTNINFYAYGINAKFGWRF